MKGFLLSEEFDKIIAALIDQWIKDKQAFTPPLSLMFRAFSECPLDDLKVVVIGQDPYPQLHVADGIAFSCATSEYPQPSLRFMLNAINETVYDMTLDPKTFDLDLKRWSNQGILMLNSALTTSVGKIGKHMNLWRPFVNYLIDMLNDRDLVWILLGSKAAEFQDVITSPHILRASHPASAVYSGGQFHNKWDCNNVFNDCNKILETKKQTQIVW